MSSSPELIRALIGAMPVPVAKRKTRGQALAGARSSARNPLPCTTLTSSCSPLPRSHTSPAVLSFLLMTISTMGDESAFGAFASAMNAGLLSSPTRTCTYWPASVYPLAMSFPTFRSNWYRSLPTRSEPSTVATYHSCCCCCALVASWPPKSLREPPSKEARCLERGRGVEGVRARAARAKATTERWPA